MIKSQRQFMYGSNFYGSDVISGYKGAGKRERQNVKMQGGA